MQLVQLVFGHNSRRIECWRKREEKLAVAFLNCPVVVVVAAVVVGPVCV